jgi:fructokinase
MTIDRNGVQCFCGKRGCVERYISGGGLSDRHFESSGLRLIAREIIERARTGDRACASTFDTFLENFGIAVGNLCSVLDPDILVLGGGLSNVDELYTEGRDRVRKYIFSDDFVTPIVKNQCGDSAGVFGAAALGAAALGPAALGAG